jgi:hypothetical protein
VHVQRAERAVWGALLFTLLAPEGMQEAGNSMKVRARTARLLGLGAQGGGC